MKTAPFGRGSEPDPEPQPSRDRRERLGTVIELLPNAIYRVELESRRQVLAHAAGAERKNFVRVRPGDRVWVELSEHDPTRGRIVKVLGT